MLKAILIPGYENQKHKIPMTSILKNSFSVLLKAVLSAGTAALALYFFLQMLGGNTRAAVVCNGVYLLMSLYLFGILCAVTYSGGAARCLTDFLFFPGRFLKTAPIILSRQQGLITRKEFAQAEAELLSLRNRSPGSPEITLMLMSLHGSALGDIPAALADAHFFFANRKWRRHELNLSILLRYADFLCDTGEIKEAYKILRKESSASFYAPDERKAIATRINSIITIMQNEKK